MGDFLHTLFNKRSLVGTLLLIILIGEPAVGVKTGLFTPGGIVLFFFLYLSIFHLFQSLILKYKLVMYQVILLTFAFYSVFVTGFLNKEITEYVLNPNIFITLIRIQASFFIAFAFYLLNQYFPTDTTKTFPLKQSLGLFFIFVLIISTTKVWGFPSLLFTIQTSPQVSLLFVILALIGLFGGLKTSSNQNLVKSCLLDWIIYSCLVLGIFPNMGTFFLLLIVMISGGIYVLWSKQLRNYQLY